MPQAPDARVSETRAPLACRMRPLIASTARFTVHGSCAVGARLMLKILIRTMLGYQPEPSYGHSGPRHWTRCSEVASWFDAASLWPPQCTNSNHSERTHGNRGCQGDSKACPRAEGVHGTSRDCCCAS